MLARAIVSRGDVRAIFTIALLAIAACSTPASAPDGGASDAASRGDGAPYSPEAPLPPEPPQPAAAPAAPVFTPCPEAWRAIDADGVAACDPWPASGRAACAADEAHLPGATGCERIGTACAADGWPSDLPAGAVVVYVDDDAATPGDGATRATALPTIAAALAIAPEGAIVAIATGRYDESELAVGGGRALWGACVAGTRVTSSVDSATAVIRILAGGGTVRNLALDAPEDVGISCTPGSTPAVLRDLVVDSALGIGVRVGSGGADLERVAIHGTRGTSASGITVLASALDARRVVIDGSARAITALGTGSVTLSDSALAGRAWASGAAAIALERVAIEDVAGLGLHASSGGEIRAREVVIDRIEGVDDTSGYAVLASSGGRISLDRVRAARATALAVFASGAGSAIDARDLVIADVIARPDDSLGQGLQSSEGARVTVERALIARTRGVGLWARAGAMLEIRDVTVRDVAPSAVGVGRGLDVFDATATAERLRIERAHELGIQVRGASSLGLADVTVRETRARPTDGYAGAGMLVADTSRVSGDRIALDENAIGLDVGPGTTMEARDLAIHGTIPEPVAGEWGEGIVVERGGTLRTERCLVERVHYTGILLWGAEARLEGSDVEIRDVRAGVRDPNGVALGMIGGARASVSRLAIARAVTGGVMVMEGSSLVARDLRIADVASEDAARHGSGWGLLAAGGGSAELTRAAIERARVSGLAAVQPGSRIVGTEVRVSEIEPGLCGGEPCAAQGGGLAASAHYRGSLALTGFLLERAAVCGAAVGPEGEMDLARGAIVGHPIGACVQEPTFDPARLREDVEYRDVAIPLQTESVALPDPPELGTPGG